MADENSMKEIESEEEIPNFETEEEAEFWSTHSLGEEYLERRWVRCRRACYRRRVGHVPGR
jgi:hypothetical protein